MLELHRLLEEYRNAEENHSASTAAGAAAIPVFDEASFQLGRYKDGALLKFRGVVHDVQDPELVLMAAPGGQEGFAGDQDRDHFTDADVREKFVERVPLKVALFPHRTDWAKEAYASGVPNAAPTVGDAAAGAAEASGIARPSAGGGKGTKRTNDAVADVEMAHASDETHATESGNGDDDSQSKKSKACSDAGAAGDRGNAQNLLLPNLISVYVYDGQYTDVALDAFKVNEAFDFIGVLDLMVLGSVNTNTADASKVLTEQEMAQMQISDHLDEMQQKQRSGVVLHCCDAVGIDAFHHVRPHHPRAFYKALEEGNAQRKAFCSTTWTSLGYETDIGAMRQRLIDYLAAALSGDAVAAEYVLVCLLSRVYSRADQATPLGNLSLNITLGNTLTADQVSSHVDQIEAAINSIVPVCTSVDLALTNLNSTKFMPHKDYEHEAMLAGALQVPHGTTMLVKETSLSAGQLNDQGVKNIGALHSLVEKMLLPYDFQFYSMDFPQDVAVVSISEGKSILPVTVSIPLAPATTTTADADAAGNTEELRTTIASVPDSLLECFRVYLGVLRTLEVTIGNEQAEIAEKHYVACRQAHQEVSLEDLHRWLRIARLVALSHGEDVVSRTTWDQMLALERRRTERVDAHHQPHAQ